MPIVIATIVSWIAFTAFWMIPKRLAPFETLLLFFLDTIGELGLFTVLHINLEFIQVAPGVDNGLADLMFRLVELPFLHVAATNLLLCPRPPAKWAGVGSMVIFSVGVQWLLIRLGMLTLHHWNVGYSGIVLCLTIALSWVMAKVILRMAGEGAVSG